MVAVVEIGIEMEVDILHPMTDHLIIEIPARHQRDRKIVGKETGEFIIPS